MPSGKKLRTPKTEQEETSVEPQADEGAVEEPAASVEVAAPPVDGPPAVEEPPAVDEPPAVVEPPAVDEPRATEEPRAKKGRRFSGFRRGKTEAAAAEAEPTETEEATTPEEVLAPEEQADDQPATATAEETLGAPTESTDEAAEPVEEEAEGEPVLVAHRPAGKRLKFAAAAAAALFVAGGAFLGATAQPVIANRALVETKLNIARTAANAITTLWSYTPENMDSLGDRSAKYLTGDFAFQYRKFIDSIVATNKQAQVTNTTSVLGSAVESVSPTEASAVVYTNSVATSPVSKNIPSLRYLSYRLEMKRDRADWRITRMTTITALDLTPQV
jgi:Mce-associated membrane protein